MNSYRPICLNQRELNYNRKERERDGRLNIVQTQSTLSRELVILIANEEDILKRSKIHFRK